MKFLFLGLNYAPEPVGIGPYTSGLAEALVARGHQVTVIAGKPYYPQWRLYDGYADDAGPQVEHGVSVTRVAHYIPPEPTGLKRLAHLFSFALSAYAKTVRAARGKPDMVFTVAPSLMAVPVAARAARVAGVPLWVHVQDFEVEASFATGLLGENSIPGRLARGVENRLLGMADVASSISPQMCARLAAKGVAPERVYELRNWSNPKLDHAAADDSAYRREWGLGTRKVALYAGNIANKQGLDTVIDAARHLAARDDIVFVICGEGPNRAKLEGLAGTLGNVQFHGLQPEARMADFLSLAAVHLLPQIVGAADLVLPSKLTNMLASGRPVVATATAGTGLYDEVDGCGLVTAPGDAAAMAGAIAHLVDYPALHIKTSAAARQRAQVRWSRDAIIDRMEARALAEIGCQKPA
ncbi:MAG: WcaI family glycosyltransferase [Croceibacterium sp.]